MPNHSKKSDCYDDESSSYYRHRRRCRGPTGATGPQGSTGSTGPQGPTGASPNFPFVRLGGSQVIANDTLTGFTGYYLIQDGGLGSSFDITTGIFTAPSAGIYQLSYSVFFELYGPYESNNLYTFSTDGERSMRLKRNSSEATYIGQYHYVPPDSDVSSRNGFLFPISSTNQALALEDLLSTSTTTFMNAGDNVKLELYQNNKYYIFAPAQPTPVPTGSISLPAFVEVFITQLTDPAILPAFLPINKKPVGK